MSFYGMRKKMTYVIKPLMHHFIFRKEHAQKPDHLEFQVFVGMNYEITKLFL